jgi:hypothetical protein
MKNSKFIMPVRADICREISKRRVYSHRKDEETGKVKKRKNPHGTSSPFGWGTVTDSFMLNVKIWDAVRRNIDLYVKQVNVTDYLEQAPPPSKKRASPAPLVAKSAPKKPRPDVPPMLTEWYAQCQQHLQSGSIGLVPDCWADRQEMPPLEELMCTQIGKTLLHYTRFIKSKI